VKNIFIDEMTGRYPALASLSKQIESASDCLISCYRKGGKVLVCGNGGSSSDSGHIVAELMKGFTMKRDLVVDIRNRLVEIAGKRGKFLAENLQQGLPAISLAAHSSLITAISNDSDPDVIFAQQVTGYGNPEDVLFGISTSGNARNVVDAAIVAKAKGMKVIGLTGKTGGLLKSYCDVLINVPEEQTHLAQELHLPVYHTICLIVEAAFF
jgi:D-sedoheptulose 7-phosphate isomerase